MAYLLIGLGAIVGANARYFVSVFAAGRWGAAFPYGTLIINVTGSAILGFTLGIITARFDNNTTARLLFAVGFCGAYTTFSTFAFETLALSRERSHLPAVTNLLASTVLALAATGAGLALASLLSA